MDTTEEGYSIEEALSASMMEGRITVEINPCDTEVSDIVDYRIRLPASQALQLIWQRYQSAN